MSYKFRMVFYHSRPGFFRIDQKSINYEIAEDLCIDVYPRDSDVLTSARKYHIDCKGFITEAEARNAGEKLRQHLRMLNCILNLGLIPIQDGNSGTVSNAIKEQIRAEGGNLLDTIVGLHVFPDDGMHFEHVASGKGDVYPCDPLYVLNAIKKTWSSTFVFDENVS